MPKLSAAQIAAATGGQVIQGDPATTFADFHFDSRLIEPGGLFFALVTDKSDGHAFVGSISAMVGTGAVVNRTFDASGLDLPLIAVEDTARAYRDLARWIREQWDNVKYIAVTGSIGKTTTREFVQQILSHRFKTYAAPGNWNNWLGVPFALFKMPASAEVAVFELAMSDPGIGEIDHLASLIRPHITCVLNAFPVHLEYLKTVDNVARAKLEINNYLKNGDIALVNGDSQHLRQQIQAKPGKLLKFGREPGNDIRLIGVDFEDGTVQLIISFSGDEHRFLCPPLTAAQVENLLAAILIAEQAGMGVENIKAAVADLQPVQGRGTLQQIDGITVVDDSYNSNPIAARTLLEWACEVRPADQVIAVLGDMLELGDDGPRYHRELGNIAGALDLAALVVVGPLSGQTASAAVDAGMDKERVRHVDQAEQAGHQAAQLAKPGMLVLFKGSRGIHLERALEVFKAQGPGDIKVEDHGSRP